VLDLQLPGVSGLDLQKQLAEVGLEIPIVFLTGHGDIPASVQAIKAGAVEFLTKPFDEHEIDSGTQRPTGRVVTFLNSFVFLTPATDLSRVNRKYASEQTHG
jgi:FixJ family two-component response regulator